LGLRERLRRQTLDMIRSRRRRRLVGLVAALAACYVLGLVSTWLWLPQPAPPVSSAATRPEIPPETSPEPHVADLEGDTDVPALVLERRGLDAPRSLQAALFRRAGNRYLDDGDIASALRCYRLALDLAPERELAIVADDSWLLMALKEARLKEKANVANGG
jgi:hypothetical protein